MNLISLATIGGAAVALLLLAATVSASVRLARHLRTDHRQDWKDEAYWLTPVLCACGALSALTGLGFIPLLQGVLFSMVLAIAAGWLLLHELSPRDLLSVRAWLLAARSLWSQARGSAGYLREDLRRLRGLRDGPEPRRHEQAAEAQAAPAAAPAAPATDTAPRTVPVAREVPSVRDDPALGVVPAPGEVAQELAGAGVAIPPEWAALCDSVASFEPDDDENELAFLAGHAAGHIAYAEAWRARTDHLLHGTRLDPAYVAGNLEYADEVSENSAALSMVVQRFHVIYGAVREWIAGGGILPKDGDWFGSGAGSTEQGTDGDIAA